MSATVLLLGKAVFALAGLAAGLHLARQVRVEKGFPTHVWASAIIFIGGIGLLGFGVLPGLADGAPARAGMIFFDACERAALFGLALFVWRVFGVGRPSRRIALGAIGGLMLLDWVHVLSVQSWPAPIDRPWVDALSQLTFALPVAWSSLEAGLEHAKSRRQARLGLCTPIAVNRFALWTAGCGALALVCTLAAVAALASPDGAIVAATHWLRAALYAGIASAIWLGFFPPAFYLRHLEEPEQEAPTSRAA